MRAAARVVQVTRISVTKSTHRRTEHQSVTAAAAAATRAGCTALRTSLTAPDAKPLADWLGKSVPTSRPLRPLRLRQDPAPRHVWPTTPDCRTSVTPDAELAARDPPWCTAATDRSLLGKLPAFGSRSSTLAPDSDITPCALHCQCEMRMHAQLRSAQGFIRRCSLPCKLPN